MDLTILKEIGLTEGEIKVYRALIKLGSTTSGPLTDESGVPRSKIYQILNKLIKKNLASYIVKEKTKYFQAEDPSKLKDYINKKEKKIQEQKEKINKLVSNLQLQKGLGVNKNEAQIYIGFKGIQTVHEHMYLKLQKGEGFYYLGIPSYQKEKYHLYWQRDHVKRARLGIKSRALFNQKTEKKVLKNRNSYKLSVARYMPFPIETPAWIMGYKDVTVIGLQSEEGMAIEIVNQQIADSFKQYFETLWKLSKKFK